MNTNFLLLGAGNPLILVRGDKGKLNKEELTQHMAENFKFFNRLPENETKLELAKLNGRIEMLEKYLSQKDETILKLNSEIERLKSI